MHGGASCTRHTVDLFNIEKAERESDRVAEGERGRESWPYRNFSGLRTLLSPRFGSLIDRGNYYLRFYLRNAAPSTTGDDRYYWILNGGLMQIVQKISTSQVRDRHLVGLT